MTKMPKPVARYRPDPDGYDSAFRDESTIQTCPANPWEGFVPLITTTQAEAYANERVREALEEAESVAAYTGSAKDEQCDEDMRGYKRGRNHAATAIRSLRNKEK